MIIPRKNKQLRDEKIEDILRICTASKRERDQLYAQRKRYFLFGTYDFNTEVKYNRLQAHTDLVSSFLYSADHVRFNIAAPRNSQEEAIQQVLALQEEWNDVFRDCGLAYLFSDAILWSLLFDSMFIKVGWNEARSDLFGTVFSPSDFGVYDESEPDLDSQEAFTHSYSLNWDNAVLRLIRAGKKDEIKNLQAKPGNQSEEDMPAVLANILITSTGGANLAGNMIGNTPINYMLRATYEPNSENPTVRFHEVWVWDDVAEDYAVFVKVDGIDGVLSDSRETVEALERKAGKDAKEFSGNGNLFLPGEHAFIHIRPYYLYNYFWGRAHSDQLIPLQDWTNERLQQIADILEKQVDPAKVFSGFMGLGDEKAQALGGPGSWVMEQIPGASVQELAPKMPEDLFVEFQQIGHIFLEASGLTETVTGQGAEGVRGGGHAKHLAMTGSGRIKKVAVSLEQPLSQCGDIGIKLMQKNSKERLTTDTGQELVPALVAERNLRIRVAGHSHSPLFSDETKESAALLFKSEAIDREMLIRVLNPPNADNMIHALRKRVKAEQEEAKRKEAAGIKEPKGK